MEAQQTEPPKSTRTDAQLAALAKARLKAAEVRAQNAEVRRKQTEADRLAAEELKRQRVEQADRELKAMQTPTEPPEAEADSKSPEAEADDEAEEEIQYIRRKRPTRKRRVIVQEESSDEEITVQLPKKREQREAFADDAYSRSYEKMFAL
jgi:hypothetical protein